MPAKGVVISRHTALGGSDTGCGTAGCENKPVNSYAVACLGLRRRKN
jgi:hypothetical protein